MNTETKKRPVRAAALTVGFIGMIILIAWLSIMIVKIVPGSFASLASLAESVRTFDSSEQVVESDDEATNTNRQNMLVVTSDTNVIGSGEDVRLSWTDASTKGSFVFSYECTDGVAIDIKDDEGNRNINCDTNYNLGDINNVTLTVNSEKERFVDIPYTLSFLGTNDTSPRATDEAILTVINDTVALTDDIDSEESLEEITETETASVVTTDATEQEERVDNTPTTPVTTTAGPGFTQEFTYTIPVSNPNGRVDLATRFLSTGVITTNRYIAKEIDNDESGAIQFEVKNFGTKTSEEWTYEVVLPSGGSFESDDQVALKPNERAVITIGFPASTVTSHDFVVRIRTSEDTTSSNNRFVETVAFSN